MIFCQFTAIFEKNIDNFWKKTKNRKLTVPYIREKNYLGPKNYFTLFSTLKRPHSRNFNGQKKCSTFFFDLKTQKVLKIVKN